jgi:hypothetical protein
LANADRPCLALSWFVRVTISDATSLMLT